MSTAPYFHHLDSVTIIDPVSDFCGKHGVIDWVYPRSVRVAVWDGTYPLLRIEVPKTAIQHRMPSHAARSSA